MNHVAITATTVLHMCDEQAILLLCYFLCQNIKCEMHIGMSVHAQLLVKSGFAGKATRFLSKFWNLMVAHKETVCKTVNKLRQTERKMNWMSSAHCRENVWNSY